MKALQKPYDTFVKTQLCELGLGNASMWKAENVSV